MYAEVPTEHVEAKQPLLKEGHVYILSRFVVRANKDKYRPVDNNYMIELTYYTMINEITEVPPNFPLYTYNLVPFENISSYVGETKTFLDVVGVIVSVSNAASIQGANQNSPTAKRLLVLKDAQNNETNLTLWGQRAKEFPAETIYKLGESKPVVALFVGLLMKRYGQIEGLSGSSACRWYILPDIFLRPHHLLQASSHTFIQYPISLSVIRSLLLP